jgi:hypothetical protein
MTDSIDEALEHRGAWTLSKDALQRLLNWLDGGANSGYRRADRFSYVALASVSRNCPSSSIQRREGMNPAAVSIARNRSVSYL